MKSSCRKDHLQTIETIWAQVVRSTLSIATLILKSLVDKNGLLLSGDSWLESVTSKPVTTASGEIAHVLSTFKSQQSPNCLPISQPWSWLCRSGSFQSAVLTRFVWHVLIRKIPCPFQGVRPWIYGGRRFRGLLSLKSNEKSITRKDTNIQADWLCS